MDISDAAALTGHADHADHTGHAGHADHTEMARKHAKAMRLDDRTGCCTDC